MSLRRQKSTHAEADKQSMTISSKIFIIDIPRPDEEDTIEAEGRIERQGKQMNFVIQGIEHDQRP